MSNQPTFDFRFPNHLAYRHHLNHGLLGLFLNQHWKLQDMLHLLIVRLHHHIHIPFVWYSGTTSLNFHRKIRNILHHLLNHLHLYLRLVDLLNYIHHWFLLDIGIHQYLSTNVQEFRHLIDLNQYHLYRSRVESPMDQLDPFRYLIPNHQEFHPHQNHLNQDPLIQD